MRDKTICIIIFFLLAFFLSCEGYSDMYERLIKAGMSKPCAMYVICKKANPKDSCIQFSTSCTKSGDFERCGGLSGLDKNELRFLKCLTKQK